MVFYSINEMLADVVFKLEPIIGELPDKERIMPSIYGGYVINQETYGFFFSIEVEHPRNWVEVESGDLCLKFRFTPKPVNYKQTKLTRAQHSDIKNMFSNFFAQIKQKEKLNKLSVIINDLEYSCTKYEFKPAHYVVADSFSLNLNLNLI